MTERPEFSDLFRGMIQNYTLQKQTSELLLRSILDRNREQIETNQKQRDGPDGTPKGP